MIWVGVLSFRVSCYYFVIDSSYVLGEYSGNYVNISIVKRKLYFFLLVIKFLV